MKLLLSLVIVCLSLNFVASSGSRGKRQQNASSDTDLAFAQIEGQLGAAKEAILKLASITWELTPPEVPTDYASEDMAIRLDALASYVQSLEAYKSDIMQQKDLHEGRARSFLTEARRSYESIVQIFPRMCTVDATTYDIFGYTLGMREMDLLKIMVEVQGIIDSADRDIFYNVALLEENNRLNERLQKGSAEWAVIAAELEALLDGLHPVIIKLFDRYKAIVNVEDIKSQLALLTGFADDGESDVHADIKKLLTVAQERRSIHTSNESALVNISGILVCVFSPKASVTLHSMRASKDDPSYESIVTLQELEQLLLRMIWYLITKSCDAIAILDPLIGRLEESWYKCGISDGMV